MGREYTQQELQNFQAAEKELRARRLVSDEVDGKQEMAHNAERILAYFESNPQIPVTVQSILEACELMKDQLHWLSQAEIAYNAAYRSLSKADQDSFGAWWFTSGKKYVETDGERGFENATKIISWAKGRSFTPATFDLAVSNLASSQGLHFQTLKAQPNPRQHVSDGKSFAPKSETNLSAREASKARQSRAKTTPAPSQSNAEPDSWKILCDNLLRDGRHSQQSAMKELYQARGSKSWRELYADMKQLQQQYQRLFNARAV